MAEAFLHKCLHYFHSTLLAVSRSSYQVSEDFLNRYKSTIRKEKEITNKLKILNMQLTHFFKPVWPLASMLTDMGNYFFILSRCCKTNT